MKPFIPPAQVVPGKKYRSERRHRIHISGPVAHADHENLEGLRLYWSLEGNWYAADGRYVLCRQVSRDPLTLEHYLAKAGHPENITVALDDTE